MKKLFILLLCFFAFTGMKVVYKNDTGEITAIGPFVDYQPQDGHSVLDEPSAIPDQLTTHKVVNGRYRSKNQQELQADQDRQNQRRQNEDSSFQSAIGKLRALGFTKQEIKTFSKMMESYRD